ncbi:MAG TPA: acyl-CoA dehydrogenase, partial [Mycobacterium sp.]
GPLCLDEQHARAVADLTVYVRQSHAERDLAALGSLAAADHADG